MGGELNSPVVKRRIKGLTDSSSLRRFAGVRESSWGEPKSPVGKGSRTSHAPLLVPARVWKPRSVR
eukprot:112653-Prorocentrum_minimum.AAC.1